MMKTEGALAIADRPLTEEELILEGSTKVTDFLQDRTGRFRQGKELRQRTPLETHAELAGAHHRDAVAILTANDVSCVPELLPERYRRMAVDAFSFFRGGAAIMAADLAHAPVAGVAVQACGDCHLMNFGAFSTPEENIMFNVNDFDETLPGVDFTFDVKRLAASVAVAADAAQISKKLARALAAGTVEAYRKHMLVLAGRSPLEAWNSHINLEQEMKQMGDPGLQRSLRRVIARARGEGLEKDDNFPRLAQSGELKIMDRKPTIFHLDPSAIDPARLFESYRQVLPPDRVFLLDRYQLKDLAFKAVGVGSVGTFCFIGLFASGDAEPLFLQIKEARRSVLEQTGAAPYQGHQGRRVVEGQRTMQAATDIFLGWTEDEASGRQFYIRRLKNRRLGGFSEIAEHKALADYARLCGRTLARAHARSGDPAMIAGYMGKGEAFDDAIASFAILYAERSAADYAAFLKAKGSSGRSSEKGF